VARQGAQAEDLGYPRCFMPDHFGDELAVARDRDGAATRQR
jgi:hypothetical protein